MKIIVEKSEIGKLEKNYAPFCNYRRWLNKSNLSTLKTITTVTLK